MANSHCLALWSLTIQIMTGSAKNTYRSLILSPLCRCIFHLIKRSIPITVIAPRNSDMKGILHLSQIVSSTHAVPAIHRGRNVQPVSMSEAMLNVPRG